MPKNSGVRISPRIAVSIPSAVGSVIATDSKTLEQFFVYRPICDRQLECGHLEGHWYWKPLDVFGFAPKSNAYQTRDDAIGSLIASQVFKESTRVNARRKTYSVAVSCDLRGKHWRANHERLSSYTCSPRRSNWTPWTN